MIKVPPDLPRQAEWWCAVNGYCDPPGVTGLTKDEMSWIYDALVALPGVLSAGLALWRYRVEAGLYPESGAPMRPKDLVWHQGLKETAHNGPQ